MDLKLTIAPSEEGFYASTHRESLHPTPLNTAIDQQNKDINQQQRKKEAILAPQTAVDDGTRPKWPTWMYFSDFHRRSNDTPTAHPTPPLRSSFHI